MSLSQTASLESPAAPARSGPFRLLKRFLPRGLFWRSLLIIVTPVVLLQGVVSYVFFERDLDSTTHWMARDIAADAAFLVALEDSHPMAERLQLRRQASRMLGYPVMFEPGANIAPPANVHRRSTIDQALDEVIAQQIGGGRDFQVVSAERTIDIRIDVHDGVLRMLVPRSRVTVTSPDIFIVWMVGSSLILLAIAILFLRNQVRPIERLALAAEAFGKGRAVPDFKPYGATEVRRAAQAFLTMRERIDRHVQQRTEMLAGVSHDLKTPLTRMKLALAMLVDTPDTRAMRADVREMEHMLDEYLEFARGAGAEQAVLSDLGAIAQEAVDAAARARSAAPDRLTLDLPRGLLLSVRQTALKRCIINLVDNALKHGTKVSVALKSEDGVNEIIVDDDGPGIEPGRREEAFRPFHRLDEGRNLQIGGVGLGLAIARDIARAHGGDIVLDKSPLGGLRATIRLPT
jgi:two-component system, OmpR family, osmolarity sensor histidine kinase EnvZ